MDDDAPELLVIEPDADDPLDRFEGWLTEAGLRLRVVRPYAGDPVPTSVDADGLLVLGGDMDAWADSAHPWLADVRELLRTSTVPTLGVCLGAQLLALATGGRVDRGAHGMEAGLVEVRRRAPDPLLDALPGDFAAATMHRDVITVLPHGADWLAQGSPYPYQAFRIGPAWGVQFHPEVSPQRYRSWVADLHPELQSGLAEAVEGRDADVAPVAQALAHAFARLVSADADEPAPGDPGAGSRRTSSGPA